MKYNYCREELKKLKHSEFNKSVIVSDGNGNITKNLGLDQESIPVLIRYLNLELKRLNKESKNG